MSVQPRKQRKKSATAPLHKRARALHVHLSKELKKTLGKKRRALRVRKGDTVKIVRGDFAGTTGTVTEVDVKKGVVFIDTVKTKKADGKEKHVPVQPSKLILLTLKEDKKRVI